MTQILTTTNRSMPPVSYLKVRLFLSLLSIIAVHFQGLDIFLGMCYFMVVASLIEYAVVGYSSKKSKDRKLRKAAQVDADVVGVFVLESFMATTHFLCSFPTQASVYACLMVPTERTSHIRHYRRHRRHYIKRHHIAHIQH